jgi:hypothetical protein
MRKSIQYLIFLYLSLFLMASKCKKKQDSSQSLGVKGTWKINQITNSSNITPSSLVVVVGGNLLFTDNGYELKNQAGVVVESGVYIYNASNNQLTFSPVSPSIFTGLMMAYTAVSELTSSSLNLKINLAVDGKPQNLILIQLTK